MMKKYLDFTEPYTIDLSILPAYDDTQQKHPSVYQEPDEIAGVMEWPSWYETYGMGILEDGWYHVWNPWTGESFTREAPQMSQG